MTKRETKIQNLQKLVEDIEKKVEKLEAQKKVYLLTIESLKSKLDSKSDDERK